MIRARAVSNQITSESLGAGRLGVRGRRPNRRGRETSPGPIDGSLTPPVLGVWTLAFRVQVSERIFQTAAGRERLRLHTTPVGIPCMLCRRWPYTSRGSFSLV